MMSYCFWKELLGRGNSSLRYPFNALASRPRRVVWFILECGAARLPQIKLYWHIKFAQVCWNVAHKFFQEKLCFHCKEV